MQKPIAVLLMMCFAAGLSFAQSLPELKLKNGENVINSSLSDIKENTKTAQPKKRKTVNSYFGAGYSLMIFTDSELNSIYPVFDTRSGNFLSTINLFFGFSIAKAVTLEIEPSLVFSNSSKSFTTPLTIPHQPENGSYAHSTNIGLFAIPIALNARFFPFYKMTTSFARLFFVGGGGGMVFVKEDYDITYDNNPNPSFYYTGNTASTSQWAPLFRIIAGFTGAGGMFGFGGEVRYNIVPLKQEANSPFKTRIAKNFNSVDLSLRFYFSL